MGDGGKVNLSETQFSHLIISLQLCILENYQRAFTYTISSDPHTSSPLPQKKKKNHTVRYIGTSYDRLRIKRVKRLTTGHVNNKSAFAIVQRIRESFAGGGI